MVLCGEGEVDFPVVLSTLLQHVRYPNRVVGEYVVSVA
jgi:hypothetical protein